MTDSPCNCKTQVPADFQSLLGPEILKFIESAQAREHTEGQLISVLHRVQQAFGYLSQDHMNAVAYLLRVPTATVSGVATFYHFFRFSPPGKHRISVCMGTACYVKGANLLAERLKEELGVDYGETSKDGAFTLEAARCLGTCGLAPVVMIDDEVHGQVTPDQITTLLDTYRRKADKTPAVKPGDAARI
jgi:NADH:ubiquinone oxidoreductase subunit E